MQPDNPYSSHRDQLASALPPAQRAVLLEEAVLHAFGPFVEFRPVGFIQFDQVTVDDLAQAFINYPIVIKTLLASVNVAGRAIERDLQIKLDTYTVKIDRIRAGVLAGYIKPMLPREIAIPALIELDRYFYTDKELRAFKGRWEQRITEQLNKYATVRFGKRKFTQSNEKFELDAAYPHTGPVIEIGIDVKRIESPRDIHKRADEIVNKATKFKGAFANGRFFAFVYYPFPSEHHNVTSRLRSSYIDDVFFASETTYSISQATQLLLGRVGLLRPDTLPLEEELLDLDPGQGNSDMPETDQGKFDL